LTGIGVNVRLVDVGIGAGNPRQAHVGYARACFAGWWVPMAAPALFVGNRGGKA
jgi:hypothetical protein